MISALTPLRGTRIRWTTLLGLVLVPLTVAGLFLWGLWSPSDRLENVTAAVVNQDEPVELDGQLVPLGRVLAAELISGGQDEENPRQNFSWVLTDAEDAEAGLADGRFATSITIPKNFSAAATSLSDGPDGARTATIEITESDRGRLLDTALSGIVTQTATRVLNQQLGEQFVGSVFVGMNSLHDGVSSAADGATQLADGGKQLSEGATQLADGTKQLADGTGLLAGGAQELAGGANGLAGGAGELAAGVAGLADGAAGLASGANELAVGAQDAANGGKLLADKTGEYIGGVNSVISGVQSGAGSAIAPLVQLRDAIESGALVPPGGVDPGEAIQGLNYLIDQLGGIASDDPNTELNQLKNGGTLLANGLADSAAGQQELASGLQGFSGGVSELAGGASQLAGGASALAGGASQLAGGAGELSAGVSELSAQTPELADGASKLAGGAEAAAQGTKTLAEGLGEAAAQIPNYTEAERKVMAETAIEAVTAEGGSDELFNAAGVPLFAGIALWAGALASFLVLSPLWSRTREAAKGVFALTLRSTLPSLLLGAVQGALAGIILPIALRYDFAQAAAFFGLAVLAGVAFALVVQGLSARFGGFGRFIAFALLVIAFTVGIVSTVPGLLSGIGDASPIGAAFDGFQAIASGASGAGGAVALLMLWAVGGVALTAWAVAKERRA